MKEEKRKKIHDLLEEVKDGKWKGRGLDPLKEIKRIRKGVK